MPRGNAVLSRARAGKGSSSLPAWMALRRWPGGAPGSGRLSKRAILMPRGDAVLKYALCAISALARGRCRVQPTSAIRAMRAQLT
eukprot:7343241-Alexandrium_andersonii.AAC.1